MCKNKNCSKYKRYIFEMSLTPTEFKYEKIFVKFLEIKT